MSCFFNIFYKNYFSISLVITKIKNLPSIIKPIENEQRGSHKLLSSSLFLRRSSLCFFFFSKKYVFIVFKSVVRYGLCLKCIVFLKKTPTSPSQTSSLSVCLTSRYG